MTKGNMSRPRKLLPAKSVSTCGNHERDISRMPCHTRHRKEIARLLCEQCNPKGWRTMLRIVLEDGLTVGHVMDYQSKVNSSK